jgi:Holliday junction resolvasome RuvABC endonuclease subunit
MHKGVLAFDLSPSLCGWCFADGETLEAGAFELPELGSDLGGLAQILVSMVRVLIKRFEPAEFAYEAPLLLKHDSLLDLRRIYGLGMVLELLAVDAGSPVREMDPKRIKNFMTGDPYAKKAAVVAAAVRLGVKLPPTKADGREDAADAVGAALVALSISDPAAASPWLAKLRGSLL